MKYKISILIIIFFVFSINIIFPWGEEGHKLINGAAVDILPAEMKIFKTWKKFLVEHSVDADKRRNNDSSEYPKHFIDIDYYKEFNSGNMIYDKAELISSYTDSIVTAMGILPWATVETFQNLTKAFQEKNRDRVLFYAADLGHYVGDGYQPMHTILNYDGQFTDQRGIHGRYESEMLNEYLSDLKSSIDSQLVAYIEDPLTFVFDYITNANSLAETLFAADKFAFEGSSSRGSDEYYRLLWFRTKYITAIQFNNAAKALASLIYTAWVDSGKPLLIEIN